MIGKFLQASVTLCSIVLLESRQGCIIMIMETIAVPVGNEQVYPFPKLFLTIIEEAASSGNASSGNFNTFALHLQSYNVLQHSITGMLSKCASSWQGLLYVGVD